MNKVPITQQQKRPISKLAKISLIFSLAGFGLVFPGSYLDHLELETASCTLLLPGLFFVGLGFLFGITALLTTALSKRIARTRTALMAIAASFICLVTLALFMPAMGRIRPIAKCEYNCHSIYYAIRRYAEDHKGKPPNPRDWCDVIKYINERELICPGARHKGEKGPCHYAINPNWEPNSPNDVVLLFETKGGWNQFGGPELISFNNHVRKGANVLFNDGHVEFIQPKDIGRLKWKADEPNNVQVEGTK